MNKTELAAVVAAKTNMSKKDAEAAVKATFDAVVEAVKAGEKVQLIGFGTFETSERAAREANNPRTGEKVQVEACKVVKFKAGQAFKAAVK